MNKIGIPCFVAILYLAICLGSDAVYQSKELKEIEQLKLSRAVNYCSDGAADAMLDTDDLGTDYKDLGGVKVNPQIALTTFTDLFMLNYGMSVNEENRQYVMMNFMPTFCVAGYDGYYIARHNKSYSDANGSSYDLAFEPKLPYTYKPNAASTDYYALNMGGINCTRVQGNTMTNLTVRPPGLTSKEDVIGQINSTLTSAIGYAIQEEQKEANDEWSNNFFLPSNLTTYTGVQPVSGPSVMALLQNVDLTTGKKVSAFSIAGSRINIERMVAGYLRDAGDSVNRKYYTYVDKLPPGITKDNATDMFTNILDAAKAGYRCDMQYFE